MATSDQTTASTSQSELGRLKALAKELLLEGNINAYVSKIFELERLSYSRAERLQA